MLALLAGIIAGTAYGQAEPYGGPPGARDPNDAYWPQPDASYDRQPDYGYDRDGAPGIDVGFFYNELSPYGEWVRHPRYGWVWFPRHVQAGWSPYSLGRWVESDYGWAWVSDEPFGWATYHYGRWAWDSQVGWLWVPGTGLPLAAPLPYRFETQSTAVRPPMAPVRRMSDPGPMSVAPRTKPAPRDKGDDGQRPQPF